MEPPKHLSRSTKAWRRKIVSEYAMEPRHVELLRLAADSLDRAEKAGAALEKAGSLTFTDRFGSPKARPPCPAGIVAERL